MGGAEIKVYFIIKDRDGELDISRRKTIRPFADPTGLGLRGTKYHSEKNEPTTTNQRYLIFFEDKGARTNRSADVQRKEIKHWPATSGNWVI